jgi:hypothetical protein
MGSERPPRSESRSAARTSAAISPFRWSVLSSSMDEAVRYPEKGGQIEAPEDWLDPSPDQWAPQPGPPTHALRGRCGGRRVGARLSAESLGPAFDRPYGLRAGGRRAASCRGGRRRVLGSISARVTDLQRRASVWETLTNRHPDLV